MSREVIDLDPGARRRRVQLQAVAGSLRDLHRLLMEQARSDYEREHGPIGSPAAFLQLLMGDPYFHWLRSLSGAMADLDELIEQEEPLTADQARLVRLRFDGLVQEGEAVSVFGARYREYLQKSPDVVMAHAAVRIALRPLG